MTWIGARSPGAPGKAMPKSNFLKVIAGTGRYDYRGRFASAQVFHIHLN
jgi:hypothetical protein